MDCTLRNPIRINSRPCSGQLLQKKIIIKIVPRSRTVINLFPIARRDCRQTAEVVAPSRFRSALEAQIGQLLSGRSCPSPGYVPADPRDGGLSFLRLQLLIRAPLLLLDHPLVVATLALQPPVSPRPLDSELPHLYMPTKQTAS